MAAYDDLKTFLRSQDFKLIIASDAQTRVHRMIDGEIVAESPAGGVSVALDPIARASGALYVARGRTEEDRRVLDKNGKVKMSFGDESYTLKRVFVSEGDFDSYYNGFANQTLWPICHVAFERPLFNKEWYEGYKRVNQKFSDAIRSEIHGKTFIWINDYQLALVPKYLGKPKNTKIGFFWHIPWPTWEIFRILPEKKELLESLLTCDFLGFHRGYQVKNFLETVRREFETRVDEEKNKVYLNHFATTIKSLPMGVDADIITSLVDVEEKSAFSGLLRMFTKTVTKEKTPLDEYFDNHKVILGVDRLDYTKGLGLRLAAIDRFLEKNPQYVGKVVYLAILAPSRETIPSYRELRKAIKVQILHINDKYRKGSYEPIHILHEVFPRRDVVNFFSRADVCLVTPLDDGMNLVSKEFVLVSSLSKDPGMLVLSQFAGSAIDLDEAILVNPYNIDEVAGAIKRALEMGKKEKIERLQKMANTLKERNVYQWAQDFIRSTLAA